MLKPGEHVTVTDVAASVGSPPSKSSVNAEMKVLEEAGLLRRLPPTGRDRHVYLLVVESAYWQACRDLAEAAAAGRLGALAASGAQA